MTGKDEKYEKMMQAIDLQVDNGLNEQEGSGNKTADAPKLGGSSININDLIANVDKNLEQNANSLSLKTQLHSISKKVSSINCSLSYNIIP